MITEKQLRSAEKYVKAMHPAFLKRDREPKRPDPTKIGEEASNIMRLWHSAQFNPSHKEHYGLARAGGLLLYSAHYGASFEDINDLCGLATAQLVTQISPDLRLPDTRRKQLVVGEVSASGPVGQAVKLAELILWGKELIKSTNKASFCRKHRIFLRTWFHTSSTLLSVMHDLRRDVVEPIFSTADEVLDRLRRDLVRDRKTSSVGGKK